MKPGIVSRSIPSRSTGRCLRRSSPALLLACLTLLLLPACGGPQQQVIIETVAVIEVVTNTPAATATLAPTTTPRPEPTSTHEPTRSEPKVLVIGLAQEPDSLYVHGSNLPVSASVRQAFLDGPIDYRSYAFQPVILETLPSLENGDAVLNSVTVAKGEPYCNQGLVETADRSTELEQLVVTFRLKDGILWEDGTPLTAQDSAFGWEVFCDEDTPNRDEMLCEQTASYEAGDELSAIWTGVPGCLDVAYLTSFAIPLPEHRLGSLVGSQDAGILVDGDYARQPIGWGPFKLDEWRLGQYIHLVRNENYFRAREGLPYLDEVYFVFADINQLLAQLQDGEIDLIASDSTGIGIYAEGYFSYWDTVFDLEGQEDIQVHATPINVWEHIDFSLQPADDRYVHFADRAVRQAIVHGTDRQRMVGEVTFGHGALIQGLAPAEHPLALPLGEQSTYEYDPDRARQLLEASGWILADDGYYHKGQQKLSVTLFTATGPFRERIARIFQENMGTIGVEVEIQQVPTTDLYVAGPDGVLFGRLFDLAEFSWVNLQTDPPCDLYLGSAVPSESDGWWGVNITGYANAEFDAACKAAMSSLATEERAAHFATTQRLFAQDLPSLPLFLRTKVAVSRSAVQNLILDPTEESDLWNIEAFDVER